MTGNAEMTLTWKGGQRFTGTAPGPGGPVAVAFDGESREGASPVQAAALALGSCMGIDIADILVKGRLELKALVCELSVSRAPEPPKKITAVRMNVVVTGDVPKDRVERAIALSHDRYCSVWHSMNPAIDFTTTVEIRSA